MGNILFMPRANLVGLVVAIAVVSQASAAGLRGQRQLAGAGACHSISSSATDAWCQNDCAGMVQSFPKYCAMGAPSGGSGPSPTPTPTPPTPTPPTPSGPSAGALPTYGALAHTACAKVAAEVGEACGDSCASSTGLHAANDIKTAYDIAKIWVHSTGDMKAVAGQPIGGGIDSCVGAVATAIAECQHGSSPTAFNVGGCSDSLSVQGTAGGLWQVSGPTVTADWALAGAPTVDGRTYNCAQYKDMTCGGKLGGTTCLTKDDCGGSPCALVEDGFGPNGSDARSPVCQARVAFTHTSNGCAQPAGAEAVPLCERTAYNGHSSRAVMDLAGDRAAEGKGEGDACWADALCITGIYGSGQWPGASPANGQTNSYGHYYKSCAAPVDGSRGWNPFDGNPKRPNFSGWTATSNGECAQ